MLSLDCANDRKLTHVYCFTYKETVHYASIHYIISIYIYISFKKTKLQYLNMMLRDLFYFAKEFTQS